jgi:hypothetical protein
MPVFDNNVDGYHHYNRGEKLIMLTKKQLEHNKKVQQAWYEDNAEKVAKKSSEYYTENKEKIALKQKEYQEKYKLKRQQEKQQQQQDREMIATKNEIEVKSKTLEVFDIPDNEMISRKNISKDLNISLVTLDRMSRTASYRMPKHKFLRSNGSYLYDKREIENWYPYAMEIIDLHKMGKKVPALKGYIFKEGSMVWGLIKFMRNNKKVVAHCAKERMVLRKIFVDEWAGGL